MAKRTKNIAKKELYLDSEESDEIEDSGTESDETEYSGTESDEIEYSGTESDEIEYSGTESDEIEYSGTESDEIEYSGTESVSANDTDSSAYTESTESTGSEESDSNDEGDVKTGCGSVKKNENGAIFKELIFKQLDDVPEEWKLNICDMKRICKYIDTSIFSEGSCCKWTGYVTNANNANKGTYVNFYFRNKKVALHRLLYSNFVAPLDRCEYLKFNFGNRGVCCNINHYEKYKYAEKQSNTDKQPKQNRRNCKQKKIAAKIPVTQQDLTIEFD